jgi:2-hydroxychromene-2-carboxylate isomerase
MSQAIDFYFDFSSPYGYLASTRIDALAAEYNRDVRWRPVLLGAVFQTVGNVPMMGIPHKAHYSWHDLERTARFHGIAFKRPTQFPQSTQVAARAVLWLQANRDDATAKRFAQAVFAAMFVQDLDISVPAQVLDIAAAMDVDRPALAAALETPAIKDALKAEVAQAIERGVFGAPFIIADGEAFWGFDRFDQLRALLKNGHI